MRQFQKILFIFFFAAALSQGVAFAASDAAKRVPVLHNGRIKPFDAFARQTLKTISGSERWKGEDATSVLLEAMKNPASLNKNKWIRIDYEELKSHLGLPKDRRTFSLSELEEAFPKVEALVKSAKSKRDRDERPSKLEQKSELLYTQIRTVRSLISGESLKEYPAAGASEFKINTEVLYLNAKPFQRAAFAYFLGFLLLTLFPAGGGKKQSTGHWLGLLAVVLALLLHTLGIAARIIVLSRPPVSNMYESMIFMNWALMAFAAIFSLLKKNATALTTGAFVSAVVMLYGDLLPIDASLEVLVPVLRSNYWLSVHVMTVVSSYGAFGLAMALGHRHLLASRFGKFSKKEETESADLIYRVIQLGVILIGTGTFLGGVWANESWGRFWGWDPKETWALITFLGYLAVVHLVYTKKMSSFALALCSVLGFLLVLMTWYGVNFVLGRGLHSYGAGTGGMNWVIYYLIFEAVFVGFILSRRSSG